ncbi:MAG: hypothetical protein K5756_00815 [Clostridiales bacterium]|nr:hypothetical protein [Clostridiales bacterium]
MSSKLFFKMVAATFMSVATFFSSIFGGVQPAKVCMIAHRGYSGRYHQNTELAFRKAAEHGSGGAETDIRMTKDGVYVCSHNATVILKDGTELSVADSTYAELTAQPLKNQKGFQKVYLCTLERYLEVMKENDMICFVELKDDYTDEQVREIFNMVERVYDLSKCILQSFEFDNLIKARELFPDLPIMLTYGMDDSNYERCFEYGFSIDADYKCVTEEMIKEFHDRGLEFAVWTANDIFALSYCKSLGVDYIESDVF